MCVCVCVKTMWKIKVLLSGQLLQNEFSVKQNLPIWKSSP